MVGTSPAVAPVDLLALTKPRITLLVMATVAAGYVVAEQFAPNPSAIAMWLLLAHTVVGAALVASGTNALNQVAERDVDALMRRTAARPLPAGRLDVRTAAIFGWGAGVFGVVYLGLVTNRLTAVVAAATLASYVLVYTPLKRRTAMATLVGAVPGALPIVGGWTAAGGHLDARVAVLFAILFLWQLPHFLALSWLYREDYGRAGLKMLSVGDADGTRTFTHAALTAAALLPVSLVPTALGLAGAVYFAGALGLGGWLLGASLAAARECTARRARRVFFASLVYLPALLGLLIVDRAG